MIKVKTNIPYLLISAAAIFCNSASAQQVIKTMLRLPDTGAKTGYSLMNGEDGEITIHAPFFRINNNGTVTDTVTGLMWQQSDGGEMSIEKARFYCDTLTLGGYTDWRLPYLNEAYSILNHQYTNPAVDPAVFVKTGAEYWWSWNVQANDSSKIWVTNSGGGAGNHPKVETVSAGGTKKFHVRAVRSVLAPVILPARFTVNSNQTVKDELTGLVWRKNASADSMTWENALMYADTCTSSGFSDWRLPNIKELQSLTDIRLVNPCVNQICFVFSGRKFWSSTTLPNQTGTAWYLDSRFGITTYDPKVRKNGVFLVRSDTVSRALGLKLIDGALKVYPNPFSSRIQIINASAGNSYLELFNGNGRLLYHGEISRLPDLSELPAGTYFLRITGFRTEVVRLVKTSD